MDPVKSLNDPRGELTGAAYSQVGYAFARPEVEKEDIHIPKRRKRLQSWTTGAIQGFSRRPMTPFLAAVMLWSLACRSNRVRSDYSSETH